jgi:hypothetical protein
MDLTQFGWRDGVLLIAAAIGVYVAIMLLRLSQLGKSKRTQLDLLHNPPPVFSTPEPPATDTVAEASTPAELPFRFPPPYAPATEEASPMHEAPPATPSFADALEASRLEQEVHQLRAEVAALREELLDLQASRRVSPQYADAMALARRGFDARGIADHCGIALGEAELVMALARSAGELHAENEHVGLESASGHHPRG